MQRLKPAMRNADCAFAILHAQSRSVNHRGGACAGGARWCWGARWVRLASVIRPAGRLVHPRGRLLGAASVKSLKPRLRRRLTTDDDSRHATSTYERLSIGPAEPTPFGK